MSGSILSRSLIALTIAASVSSAYAAPQTADVTGTLANWKSWNASSKAPMPVANAKIGIDLVQGLTVGAVLDYAGAFISIPVTGEVDYDDVSGVVSAIRLTQSTDFTGYYDVDADLATDDSYANSGAGGAVTYSGLAWSIDASGMHQLTGSATGCDAVVPQCQFTEDGVNANDHSNGLLQSVFDFQGINAGFQTLPKTNATGTAHGTIAKTWVAIPAVTGLTVNTSTGAITLAVASRVNSGVVTTNAANTATVSLTATLSNPEDACTAGQYWNGAACVDATPGHYALGNGALVQIDCVAGTYQPISAQSSCLMAAAGNFVAGTAATAQTPAPAGSFVSIAQATAATPCAIGSYQAIAGQTSCNQASPGNYVPNLSATFQTACTPGNYQPNAGAASCVTASANFYVAISSAIAQTACPVGSTSPAGSDNVSDCVRTPLNCPAGSYDNGVSASCITAPAGSYVPSANATSATACAAGTYQNLTGQTSCKSATAGNFVASTGATSQVPAPAGKFVAGTNATAATVCAVGTYQPLSGQTSCLSAALGNYVPTTGAAAQTLASANFYVDTTGASSQTACAVGYTSPAGSDSASDCLRTPLSCPAGSYDNGVSPSCITAPAGSYVPTANATSATACAAGTYQNLTGQTSCKSATAGNFVASTGATSQTPAPAGKFVVGTNATAATVCAVGTYQPLSGQTSCLSAVLGNYVPTTGATAQTLASANFYVDTTGASSQTACPAGTASPAGSDSASDCQAVALNCPAGQYETAGACVNASAGYYVPVSGSLVQTACAAGTYQDLTGQTSCKSATPGNFVASTAAVAQTPAPAGKFVAGTNATAATVCAVGTYQPLSGQTSCLSAALGNYVPTTGATAQTQASANFYVDTIGSASQTACPAGSTSPVGASSCTVIPVDNDGDGVQDSVDNCPAVKNADQLNTDGDSQGNACDSNDDNDAFSDIKEVNFCHSNPLDATSGCSTGKVCGPTTNICPTDTDGDKIPDWQDSNDDNDAFTDVEENLCGSNPLDASSVCVPFIEENLNTPVSLTLEVIDESSSQPNTVNTDSAPDTAAIVSDLKAQLATAALGNEKFLNKYLDLKAKAASLLEQANQTADAKAKSKLLKKYQAAIKAANKVAKKLPALVIDLVKEIEAIS